MQLEREERPSRNVSVTRTWRHAEATASQAFPFGFMILEPEGELRSLLFLPLDGENGVELGCHGPTGQFWLVSGRHAGVHPLEQLQHQVSRSGGSRPTYCCCSVLFR